MKSLFTRQRLRERRVATRAQHSPHLGDAALAIGHLAEHRCSTNTASNEPEANGSLRRVGLHSDRVGPLTDQPQHLDLEVEHRQLPVRQRRERSRD